MMYTKTFFRKIMIFVFLFLIFMGTCFASMNENDVQNTDNNNGNSNIADLLSVINECVDEIKKDIKEMDNTLNKLDNTNEYEKYPAIRLNIDTPFFGLGSMVDQKLKIKNDVSTVDVATGYSIKDVVNNMSIKLPDFKIGNIVVSTRNVKLDKNISESDAKIVISKLVQYISQVKNTNKLLNKRINNIFEGYIPKDKLEKIDMLNNKLKETSNNLISKDSDVLTVYLLSNDEVSKSINSKYYEINERVYTLEKLLDNILLNSEELEAIERESVSLELETLNYLRNVNTEKEKLISDLDVNLLLNNTNNILKSKKDELDEYVKNSVTPANINLEDKETSNGDASQSKSLNVANYTVTSKYIIDYEKNLLNNLEDKIKYYIPQNDDQNNIEVKVISDDEKQSLLQDVLKLYEDFTMKENKFYLDNLNYLLRDTTYKLSKLPEYADVNTVKDLKYIYINLPDDIDTLLDMYSTKSLIQTEVLTKELSSRLLKLVKSNSNINIEYNKFNLS